ncbi:MucB/RseB C-terminal domain-containing protein [uncultured Microbulbifer sp.]|uniref:MucB/RseB C-terminal domain-containing protein n=1 Tax=uncultured Microbulbifer sp. TaxID=348147 RepID=UPI0026355069|nr:MucB/RseB C-terminal domain-containing protein [uncultured Microbulbifer sp.]
MTKAVFRGSLIRIGIRRASSLLLASSLLALALPVLAQDAVGTEAGISSSVPSTIHLDMASSQAAAATVVSATVEAATSPASSVAGQESLAEPSLIDPTVLSSEALSNPGAVSVAVAGNEVEQWLAKLATAVAELEYSGLVTFEHAGMLETLQVVHAVRDGEQVERVRYLSGEPRELISHGSGGNCEFGVSPSARTTLWNAVGQQQVQRAYQFILRGEERIADRDAVVIEARPRDRYRLGLVVSLDRETGLPLKTMLVSTQGRVLERYQFVQLDLSPIEDSALDAVSKNARRVDNRATCESSQSRWQVRWLPEGFKVVSVKPLSDGDMMVFSDGLGVFTVFVQRLGPELEDFKGRAIRGATVAYMDRMEVNGVAYTITVVGEIPDATARRVASSIIEKG